MKTINILSLVQARASLSEDGLARYLSHYCIVIKNEELNDLQVLANALYDISTNQIIFDDYYVGYTIPQIGKEFDLLRIGNECVVNIELKSNFSEEKIHKQLLRNKYYLSYIARKLYNFTFVSESKNLYFLNDNDELEPADLNDLIDVLISQSVTEMESADYLFNPTDYLVSPFNSTKKFLENKYFLTNQQEDVKSQIIKSFGDVGHPTFVSVTGSAGTGKTLLVYDIVKELRKKKEKPLIVHCGNLNNGHTELMKNGWEIIPIKDISGYDLSEYQAIIIDEAQRVYIDQLDKIIDDIRSSNGNCVFSYDKVQTLSSRESKRDIDGRVCSIDSVTKFNLSEKIRTNREIATFIKAIFNNKRDLKPLKKGNIEFNYFNCLADAKRFLDLLAQHGWEVLRFTPSQYKKEHHEKYSNESGKTSHEVIGQEFDRVAVALDQHFSYDKKGELIYSGGAYYDPTKMLFQNITRTRKKISIVIIDNSEILDRCINILQF